MVEKKVAEATKFVLGVAEPLTKAVQQHIKTRLNRVLDTPQETNIVYWGRNSPFDMYELTLKAENNEFVCCVNLPDLYGIIEHVRQFDWGEISFAENLITSLRADLGIVCSIEVQEVILLTYEQTVGDVFKRKTYLFRLLYMDLDRTDKTFVRMFVGLFYIRLDPQIGIHIGYRLPDDTKRQ